MDHVGRCVAGGLGWLVALAERGVREGAHALGPCCDNGCLVLLPLGRHDAGRASNVARGVGVGGLAVFVEADDADDHAKDALGPSVLGGDDADGVGHVFGEVLLRVVEVIIRNFAGVGP